jgi:predicted phosphoribosyltransferase
MFLFLDRNQAGEQLATRLLDEPLVKEAARDDLLVLSIPRGGVVVGAAIARILGCAHELVAVKKLGCPGQKELAIGAMAEEGLMILNKQITRWDQPEGDDYLTEEIARVKSQLEAYIQNFRQGRGLDLQSKIVIIVDDGIATGETMKAALIWMLSRAPNQHPKKVVVAVPVCSPRAVREFTKLADKFIYLAAPEQFWAVGQFYWVFDQVSDEEVKAYLSKNMASSSSQPVELGLGFSWQLFQH